MTTIVWTPDRVANAELSILKPLYHTKMLFQSHACSMCILKPTSQCFQHNLFLGVEVKYACK